MGMGEVEPARRALAKSPVDPATLLEPKSLPYPIREYEPKTLHDLLGVGGLSSAAYSAQLLRTCCITVRNRPADTRGQGPVSRGMSGASWPKGGRWWTTNAAGQPPFVACGRLLDTFPFLSKTRMR
jgi:hypothetical protein